jgi:hypothetical protein
MKALALAFTLALIAAVSATAAQALAAPNSHAKAETKLTIVMHDPGCHWFQVGGKYLTKTTTAGPVKLTNFDEKTLIVKSNASTKRIPVGKQLLLGSGHYTITMVGQAPDDNHLKLTVN